MLVRDAVCHYGICYCVNILQRQALELSTVIAVKYFIQSVAPGKGFS